MDPAPIRIAIDRDQCMGSGNCTLTAPGVFALDDAGIAVVLDPEAQPERTVLEAARGCPTHAISITRAADDERVV